MTLCWYAALVGRHCGGSVGNPANTQCVTMGNCAKDIRNHLKSFGAGFADSTLKTEVRLLFARAGTCNYLVLYKCIHLWKNLVYGKWHALHGLKKHANVSLLHYVSRFFATKMVAINFSWDWDEEYPGMARWPEYSALLKDLQSGSGVSREYSREGHTRAEVYFYPGGGGHSHI